MDEKELERICREHGIDDEHVAPGVTLGKGSGHVTVFVSEKGPQLASAAIVTRLTQALPTLPLTGEGDLQIVDRIAEGGMGVVDLARQHSLARHVAIKRVKTRPPTADDMASLIGEAQLTGRLEHPNIIPVHALGRTANDEPLLVMKRVDGLSWLELLEDHYTQNDGMNDRERVRHIEILMQVSHALEYAHAQNVLHLDIKPENVMIGDFGEVYLLDWGVAIHQEKLAEMPAGRLIGTPSYLPPELVFGIGEATRRSDVYLMGATLHHILTGAPRHLAENTARVLHMALLSLPATYPAFVPEALAEIANKACHPEPSERYESIAHFREALQDYLLHRGSVTLTAQGHERLEELRWVLEDEERLEPRLQALFTECRFAFEQAVREWPGNERALLGRRESLELMLRYEIDRRRPDVAAALLDALGEPRPELAREIEGLRESMAVERDARLALEQLEYAMRIRTGDWKKTFWTLFSSILWVASMEVLAVLWRAGVLDLTPGVNLFLGAGFGVVTLGVFYVGRKVLIPNDIHKRFVMGCCMVLVAFVLNRLVGVLLDIKVEHTFVADYLILFTFMGAAAALVSQARWWVVALIGGLTLLAALLPDYVLDFGALIILALNLHYAYDSRPLEDDERLLLKGHQNPL